MEIQSTAENPAAPRTWHVRCRNGMNEQVTGFLTSDAAIEAACHLLDHGDDVIAISQDAVAHAIEREEIALIYARWVRARHD